MQVQTDKPGTHCDSAFFTILILPQCFIITPCSAGLQSYLKTRVFRVTYRLKHSSGMDSYLPVPVCPTTISFFVINFSFFLYVILHWLAGFCFVLFVHLLVFNLITNAWITAFLKCSCCCKSLCPLLQYPDKPQTWSIRNNQWRQPL